MSELQALLCASAERLFKDLAERGTGDAAKDCETAWPAVSELGLPLLMVPEGADGAGGTYEDLRAVLAIAGAEALPAPLGETIVANALLAEAGLPVEEGAVTLGVDVEKASLAGDKFSGTLSGVRYGRGASAIVMIAELKGKPHLVRLARSDAKTLNERVNLAGEPTDQLVFDNATANIAPTSLSPEDLRLRAAFVLTCMIEGALGAALTMTVEYAKTRVQFAKPLSSFQAIQQQLALFASNTAAVASAAAGAARAADCGDPSFEFMAAKLRANIAVGICTDIAHQVHGAIGITREYPLHRLTPRLWSWRSACGTDRIWAEKLGARLAAQGPDAFWADLTARGDRRPRVS